MKRNNYRQRGTSIAMMVVIAIVVTGLIVTMGWVTGIQSANASNARQVDQSFYAAEAGAQRVAWYCKTGAIKNMTSPLTGTMGAYSYSTSWTTQSATTYLITSQGYNSNSSYTLTETVQVPLTSLPVIAMAGDFDNKNIVVTGDVEVGGNYTNGGSGTLNGNLTYGGTASNTSAVTGTVTKGSFNSIDFAALKTKMAANAGATYSGNLTNPTFDFTALSGTNKVIYVTGNVTNPTFIGSGTLYVDGTVTTDSFGSSSTPVNVVASGDVTTSNNMDVYGGLYIGGNWTRGKINLTGMVYTVGSVNDTNTGHSSITDSFTPSTAPWFDQRTTMGGTITQTTFSKFTGPNP